MSNHGSQIKSYLGISALVSFYGIASILVLYLGPSIGLTYTYEIIIIALLLLTWPIAILINSLRNRRARKREAAEAAAASAGEGGAPQAAPVKGGSAPKRVYEELTRGAEEAVQWLRSTRLGGAKSNDALYALPWFLVAGPNASGKTSLVLSSGLDFHALPSQRRAEMKIVRPTPHVEWRVTDSAVLLDTSGRYQGDGPARDEWIALTETIKKHRNNRPLDGFLVAVNAARLLQSSDADIEQQAKTLRARLDELIQLVRTRFPVYLVFTHIDGLPGFAEFFKGGKGVNEVWGATIPLEKSANAHALFDLEFDHLYESLLRQRLLRLRVPATPDAQLRIFDFPLRFAEKREKLGLFASALFRPNPFSESPLLRGFYFTANITSAGAAAAHVVSEEGEERTAKALGRGFFTDRFFKEVVLTDKDLAKSFQASKKKPPRTSAVLLILGLLLLVLLLFGSVVSFFANRKLATEAVARAVKVDDITKADFGKDVTKKDDAAARVEVEALGALREQLIELESTPPFYMRFGFYAGNKLAPPLREVYYGSVEQRFKKPTVKALETDLRNFAAGQPTAKINTLAMASDSTGVSASSTPAEEILGRHYDLLKAYLMLADPSRVEPTFLANTLADYWKMTAPPDTSSIEDLTYYTRQLVREEAPHIPRDDRLVAEVRKKLQEYPAVNRFYKRLITDINAKANAVSIDSVLEGRGGGALKGSYTVPGSYTINGYRNYMKSAIENAGEEITKDDWVMGQAAGSGSSQSADIAKLNSLYLRDYTDQWRKFVRGVNVPEFKTREFAIETLRALSATDSPMERVMSTVAQNTHLSAKEESTGLWGWIKSWFSSSSDDDDLGGNTEVEKEFRPLFQFVSSDPKKKDSSPMSNYRAEFRRVLDPLEAASESQLQQASQSLLTGKDEFGVEKAQQNVAVLLEGFKTAAATDTAALLKRPLERLRELMFGGGSAQIIKGWEEQVYPKAHAIESGYPFTDTGEASIADLSNFLNPANGQFSTYFNQKLASYLEDSQGQWRLKETSPVAFSDDFIKYLNNARRLQEALFASKGQQPEVGYQLTVQPVANTDVIVEIDGNKIETRGNSQQSATFTWPARSGSTSGVKISVVPADGTAVDPKTFPGSWGLFKMLDASARPSTSGDQYELTWDVGTVQVHATLRPASTNNPFQRSLFRNLHAPQNLRK